MPTQSHRVSFVPKSHGAGQRQQGQATDPNGKSQSNDIGASRLPVTPLSVQNAILQAFCRAFPQLLNPNTLHEALYPRLQRVKQFLYDRDFEAAFGSPENLEAYAARWSPSRALAYVEIFSSATSLLRCTASISHDIDENDRDLLPNDVKRDTLRVTCLGGGAGAEVAACLGLPGCLVDATHSFSCGLKVEVFDSANWRPVLDSLSQYLLSMGGCELDSQKDVDLTTTQLDLLTFPLDKKLEYSIQKAHLVTIMFTLNELYATSIAKTQRFLFELSRIMSSGAALLVVDSPGSYSTVTLGKKEKQYPMAWLLDHALLVKAPEAVAELVTDAIQVARSSKSAERPVWQKLRSVPSMWWRQPSGLQYPIEIENMRYQLHIYRRL